MREINLVFDPERKLVLYFGLAFLTAFIGPFGTYGAFDFWQRLMFWMLDVVGGFAIILPVLHVFYRARAVRFLPPLVRFVAGIALGAFPAAGYITLLYNSVSEKLTIATPYPQLVLEVVVFSTALLLFEFVAWPAIFEGPARRGAPDAVGTNMPDEAGRDAGDPQAPPPPHSAFSARLPHELRGGRILSISMQDHYAEVTTTAGTALVLIRMADAVALLDGVEGARIHRSHWVAREAASGLERAGKKLVMRLRDGRSLPVSASYLDAARALVAKGEGAQ